MATFTIVSGDDWTGLYIDGSLIVEGHSLDPIELLGWANTNGPVTRVEQLRADDAWLHREGNLPSRLLSVRQQKSPRR